MPRPMALLLATTIALVAATAILAADATLPLLVEDDFEHGADRWAPTDAKAWKITEIDGGKVYDQFKDGAYRGPHRSPYNISLLKDVVVGDFVLTVKVKSTDPAGGAHRDVCLFFGYQDPANFYYVHLGERPDPNSSQIMIVDDAPRKMITTQRVARHPLGREVAHGQDRPPRRRRHDRGLLRRHEETATRGQRQDVHLRPGRPRLVRRHRPVGRFQAPRRQGREEVGG